MQTYSLKIVSNALPILVRCKAGQEDGWAGSEPVRIISDADILKAAKTDDKRFAADWSVLKGIQLLQRARDLRDMKTLRDALKLIRPAIKHFEQNELSADDPVQMATFEIKVFGPRALSWDANWEIFLAELITKRVAGTSPIGWRGNQPGRPGLARAGFSVGMCCPDLRTAFAYKMLCNGIRVCLHCHSLFVLERPKQNCCKPACVEAHRQARFQLRKKMKATAKRRNQR